MRSLIVDLSKRFGGASSRALSLAQGLGGSEAAMAVMEGSPTAQQAEKLGLACYSLARHKLDPRIAARMAARLREGDFQIIDTQNAQSQFWAYWAARRTGCALVATLNSWYENEYRGSLRGRFYQSLERASRGRVDLFIAVSDEIRQRLRGEGVAAERIALIPNAIALDAGRIPADPSRLREQYGLPAASTVACAVGRLVTAKGYTHLIEAMARLVAGQADLYCLIVGGGPLHAELTQAIRAAGLDGRVRLLGDRPRDEALSIMKAADLFVMPSVTEGTPVALLEAAALGKPIIASRVGGIPSILEHERTALLIPAGDPEALAAAMTRLSGDRPLGTKLGQAACAQVARHFSLHAQVEATRAAYAQAWQHAQRGNKG